MQKQIKQVWLPYWKWEDYKAGMWLKEDKERLSEAIEFTADHKIYGEAMREVVSLWSNTMINSLTNPSINQRAFVGHCAVCYRLGISERTTRKAWKYLTQNQRDLADNEAQQTINEWRIKYLNTLKHGRKGVIENYQMKLQMS